MVGVPEMAPVVALRLRPVGRVGLMVKLPTVPATVGVSVAIAVPTVAAMVVWG